MDNHLDNAANLRSSHVSEGRTAQRNVHSTFAHDEMAVTCEQKYNTNHTRSWDRSNPDIDVWQMIDGNLSTTKLRAKPHVGEVQ